VRPFTGVQDLEKRRSETFVRNLIRNGHKTPEDTSETPGKTHGKIRTGGRTTWGDLPKGQWELLWEGETTWKKYGDVLWETGYKTVTLFPGASETPLHSILRMTGDGIQTQHPQVPYVKRMPATARKTIQSYLNLVDWRYIQDGGVPGGCQRLVRLIGVYPVEGATGIQRYPITRGGRSKRTAGMYS